MELVDTHCHIHEVLARGEGSEAIHVRWLKAGKTDPQAIIQAAAEQGVNKLICVGTTLEDSRAAVEFAGQHQNVWASVGVHPHEAQDYVNSPKKLQQIRNLLGKDKVVAVGECGLDYHYEHSPKDDQKALLAFHFEQAPKHDLTMIFHIREAFDDFWEVFDRYQSADRPIRGVVHSFSSTPQDLEEILKRGLYVGLNGIMTFTKDKRHLEAAKAVPLERLLLETDAPFLTPAPYRGKICEPKYVRDVAEFLSQLRGEPLDQLAAATSANAKELFKLI